MKASVPMRLPCLDAVSRFTASHKAVQVISSAFCGSQDNTSSRKEPSFAKAFAFSSMPVYSRCVSQSAAVMPMFASKRPMALMFAVPDHFIISS